MSNKWEEILKKLQKEARDEGLVNQLLQRAKDDISDSLLWLAEEKEQDLQKIKLQLVAKNKNDLKDMEWKLEEDLEKEK